MSRFHNPLRGQYACRSCEYNHKRADFAVGMLCSICNFTSAQQHILFIVFDCSYIVAGGIHAVCRVSSGTIDALEQPFAEYQVAPTMLYNRSILLHFQRNAQLPTMLFIHSSRNCCRRCACQQQGIEWHQQRFAAAAFDPSPASGAGCNHCACHPA